MHQPYLQVSGRMYNLAKVTLIVFIPLIFLKCKPKFVKNFKLIFLNSTDVKY